MIFWGRSFGFEIITGKTYDSHLPRTFYRLKPSNICTNLQIPVLAQLPQQLVHLHDHVPGGGRETLGRQMLQQVQQGLKGAHAQVRVLLVELQQDGEDGREADRDQLRLVGLKPGQFVGVYM